MVSLPLPGSAILILAGAAGLVGMSWALAKRERWTAAVLCVAGAALLIRAYAAADLVLHPWDERFHALVAKHLIDNPLVPTLYADPVLPYNPDDWYSNHIWLHKPPLALWIQAASMRTFGAWEIPLRLPSVVFATAGVVATFAIGRIVFSPAVGLVAAILHALNGFLVDLASGRRASDHVDTLLIVMVEAGILVALLTQQHSPRLTSIALGIVCGLGYLTKSLPALLLLPIWGLMRWQLHARANLVRDIAMSALFAVVVASPWIVYASTAFPLEWQRESTYAWRHVIEPLETHGGRPWQYVKDLPRDFDPLVYIPLGFAFGSVMFGAAPPARRAMLMWVAVPYALFSVMARSCRRM